ncbi:MAG: histidinol dehydrogenase, partial [Smithellaceae bacterium]|nr:histidinol dehydrogenase [Smithellaceae bacterium]
MRIIRSDAAQFRNFFQTLRARGGAFTPELQASVAQIVHDVSLRGDEALFYYTQKFDGCALTASTVEATPAERKDALAKVKPEDRKVIELAAR